MGLLVEEVHQGIGGGGSRGLGWRGGFEAVRLDEKIDGFAVLAQHIDQAADLAAALGGGLEKLNAHAKFRVAEANDAKGAILGAGLANRESDAGGGRER